MDYTMRSLQTQDVFRMSKILKKMNLKTDISKIVSEIGKKKDKELEKNQEVIGAEIILLFLENLHLAQNEVNEFLANLVGIKADEFNKLPIKDTVEIINKFKEQTDIISFFKLAGQLTK